MVFTKEQFIVLLILIIIFQWFRIERFDSKFDYMFKYIYECQKEKTYHESR